MNLNDFVVLPNNKAKSVKLNARNLQELHMETVTLAQESNEMEEKLQQLKERMSKEKQEREHAASSRWKSGKCGSFNSSALTNYAKKNTENRLQKLSAGKVKIQVLKDEPLTDLPKPTPPRLPPTIGPRTTRKNRLKGTCCVQCEVKTAGLVCAECAEDYCIGCFTKFHQKGALKLHRMIPIQTYLQTHVSARDVVSCFQRQINLSSYPSTSTSRTVVKPTQLHPDSNQVGHGEEKKVDMTEEGQRREDERGLPISLFRGEYNEEESARSFQEALRQWREEKSDDESGKLLNKEAMWTPFRSASVSDMVTQADLAPDREGGREGRVPVRVEFTENSLTYMDRLLLKKHRRAPIETYCQSLDLRKTVKSLSDTNTMEETASSLTAQEEDFRRYCASLFAVPVSMGRTEPQITTPESCLVIEVLDESDGDTNGVFVSEQRTDNNRKFPSVQQVLSKETALTSGGSSRVSCSSPSPTQLGRQSRGSAQPKAAQKLHLSKPQTSQAEHLTKSLSSKSKPSACTTAETPRTSKTSIKTPTSTSQKPSCPPNVHKSNLDRGSIQLLSSPSLANSQTEIPKLSHSPLSFPLDVFPLADTRHPILHEHLSPSPAISFSLRSTFTASPSSSTDLTLLPKVYQSTPLQRGSDSSLLPEEPHSSHLSPEPTSSPNLSQSPPSNLEFPRQSQHSHCDPESLLSDNQLSLPAVSSSPNPAQKSAEPIPPVIALSSLSLFKESPPDAYSSHGSTPTIMSSTLISGEHESTQDPPLAGKIEEEEELSVDSEDDMSTDSLDLDLHEEDSSDEEQALMHGHLARGRTREEEQGIPALSHIEEPFVPADVDRERDLWTDEQERLSGPSMVMHNQSAGSGSEQFCGLDEFTPLGLDMNSGHSDTPENTHCDPVHTCQISPRDSDTTGSEGYGPSSSLSTYTEEHLLFRMMDNHMQPAKIHSTRPTRRGEISTNEPGTSGSELVPAFRPLSRAAEEIMEICGVDHTGCEDPDLDTDTTAHTPRSGAGTQTHGQGGQASEEQKEEEAATQRDQQSVLLLP